MKESNIAAAGSIGSALSLLSCRPSIDVERMDPARRPTRVESEIQVLVAEPTRPYRSIAVVAIGGGLLPNLRRWLHRITSEAARLGGDAVLLVHQAESPILRARVIVFDRDR